MAEENEIQNIIDRGLVVDWIFKDDPDNTYWGTFTCLSDCKTTVYYKPKGMGLFRGSAAISKIEIIRKG